MAPKRHKFISLLSLIFTSSIDNQLLNWYQFLSIGLTQILAINYYQFLISIDNLISNDFETHKDVKMRLSKEINLWRFGAITLHYQIILITKCRKFAYNKLIYVNNLALMESDCTFRTGFNSLMYSISCRRQSNLLEHFLRTIKLLIKSSGAVLLCSLR